MTLIGVSDPLVSTVGSILVSFGSPGDVRLYVNGRSMTGENQATTGLVYTESDRLTLNSATGTPFGHITSRW
jgi:hypothetical protein